MGMQGIILKKQIIKKSVLLILMLFSSYFFICAIIVPVAAHYGMYELAGKLDGIFLEACHRQPLRSFWIFGYPVSLCCRCLGFYFAVSIFTLCLLINKLKNNIIIFGILTIAAISDIVINLFFNINTSDFQRFFAGICLGYAAVSIIQFIFKKGEENEKDFSRSTYADDCRYDRKRVICK